VAVVFIIGFQVAIRQRRAVRFGWGFMTLAGFYFVATGISALVIAVASTNTDAAALLFVSLGAGLTAGAALARVFFRANFAT
jgi:hypothetical protein